MAPDTELVEPIFVSVKDAAKILGGISPMAVYELCNKDKIETRYFGRRRLVVLSSLREYASGLPLSAPPPKSKKSA